MITDLNTCNPHSARMIQILSDQVSVVESIRLLYAQVKLTVHLANTIEGNYYSVFHKYSILKLRNYLTK